MKKSNIVPLLDRWRSKRGKIEQCNNQETVAEKPDSWEESPQSVGKKRKRGEGDAKKARE